jgi:hypothetical protein
MLISVPEFKVYSIRLPEELKERILPPDAKVAKRAALGVKKPVGFSGGKQGGLSLLIRRMLHLYLGEQMPGGQWRLEMDDADPLRQMESRVYALEAAAYDEGRRLTPAENAELQDLESKLLELAHERVAGREQAFETILAVALVGRCLVLAHHEFKGN